MPIDNSLSSRCDWDQLSMSIDVLFQFHQRVPHLSQSRKSCMPMANRRSFNASVNVPLRYLPSNGTRTIDWFNGSCWLNLSYRASSLHFRSIGNRTSASLFSSVSVLTLPLTPADHQQTLRCQVFNEGTVEETKIDRQLDVQCEFHRTTTKTVSDNVSF